jgi:hypothetical protein
MYLRAVLCTFHISVDFYCVPVGGRGGGRGGWRGGGGEEGGEEGGRVGSGVRGARGRGIECILYGYS